MLGEKKFLEGRQMVGLWGVAQMEEYLPSWQSPVPPVNKQNQNRGNGQSKTFLRLG